MILFFDADLGTAVPIAIRSLEVIPPEECSYMEKVFRRGSGQHTKDEEWIPYVGDRGWFVISCNTAILESEAQRQLWIDHKVGGMFITTGQGKKYDVFKLIARKLEWMRLLDITEPRPFAYLMPISGNKPRKAL